MDIDEAIQNIYSTYVGKQNPPTCNLKLSIKISDLT